MVKGIQKQRSCRGVILSPLSASLFVRVKTGMSGSAQTEEGNFPPLLITGVGLLLKMHVTSEQINLTPSLFAGQYTKEANPPIIGPVELSGAPRGLIYCLPNSPTAGTVQWFKTRRNMCRLDVYRYKSPRSYLGVCKLFNI